MASESVAFVSGRQMRAVAHFSVGYMPWIVFFVSVFLVVDVAVAVSSVGEEMMSGCILHSPGQDHTRSIPIG